MHLLNSALSRRDNRKKKEKDEANQVVNDEIFSLKVKRKCLLEHCSVLQDRGEKLADLAEKILEGQSKRWRKRQTRLMIS